MQYLEKIRRANLEIFIALSMKSAADDSIITMRREKLKKDCIKYQGRHPIISATYHIYIAYSCIDLVFWIEM
jgi:hypothetical protein